VTPRLIKLTKYELLQVYVTVSPPLLLPGHCPSRAFHQPRNPTSLVMTPTWLSSTRVQQHCTPLLLAPRKLDTCLGTCALRAERRQVPFPARVQVAGEPMMRGAVRPRGRQPAPGGGQCAPGAGCVPGRTCPTVRRALPGGGRNHWRGARRTSRPRRHVTARTSRGTGPGDWVWRRREDEVAKQGKVAEANVPSLARGRAPPRRAVNEGSADAHLGR